MILPEADMIYLGKDRAQVDRRHSKVIDNIAQEPTVDPMKYTQGCFVLFSYSYIIISGGFMFSVWVNARFTCKTKQQNLIFWMNMFCLCSFISYTDLCHRTYILSQNSGINTDVIILSISYRVTSMVMGQSYDCPIASEVTLKEMVKLNGKKTKTKKNP